MKEKACLLLHGLGGGYFQFKDTMQQLHDAGVETKVISFKGHERKLPKMMAKARFYDWIDQATRAYKKLELEYEKVIVVGFSMGSLISIYLGQKFTPAAMVLVNTPIYFWNIKLMAKNISKDVRGKNYQALRRFTDSVDCVPLRTYIEFYRLLLFTRKRAKDIECPVFILQSKDDETVQMRSVKYLLREIGHKNKHRKVKFYQTGGHEILVDHQDAAIHNDIVEYVRSI